MGSRIWGVRYPELAFDVVETALVDGSVNWSKIQEILTPARNKSKAEGYLNFCLQMGLLYPMAGTSGWYRRYGPTPRGRTLYVEAQKNSKAALIQLLASCSVYRYQAELLLAELVLGNSLRRPGLMPELRQLILSVTPWFFDGRFQWIRDTIGWVDSSSYVLTDAAKLHQRLIEMNSLHAWVDGDSCGYWDSILGFGSGSDLSRAEHLCAFLQASRPLPIWFPSGILSSAALHVLILLMTAREQGYAVVSRWCGSAIDELRRLGIDIRRDDDAAYLNSALHLAISDVSILSYAYLESLGQHLLIPLFSNLSEQARDANCGGAIFLDLDATFQATRRDLLDHGIIVQTPLTDNGVGTASSGLQVWFPPCLPDQDEYNFLDELIRLTGPRAITANPSVEIFLSNANLAQPVHLDVLVAHNPHFALLLLLLCDVGGAADELHLVNDGWRYGGVDLISALDQMLRHLGFRVWDEGYRLRPERCKELGRGLVELAQRVGLCYVEGTRLVERSSDGLAGTYYYRAVRAVSVVRGLELLHA